MPSFQGVFDVRSIPERLREFYINFSFRQSVPGYARPIRQPNIFLVAQVIIIDIFFFFLSFFFVFAFFLTGHYVTETVTNSVYVVISILVDSGYYND